MKITQFNPDHPYLLGAGITLGSTASPVDPAIIEQLTNQSGGSVAAGDVVLLDTAHDESFVTTSLSFVTSAIGIALDTIASGAAGSVITAGFAPVVNVNGSNTTRGHYLGTGAAKAAATAATRQAGTFGQLLTGGTAPSATIWAPDLSAGGNPGVGTVTDGTTTVTGVTEIDFTSGATVSAGGAGIVNVAVTGGGLPVINVLDYGAVEDFSTDNATAFAAAIAAMVDGCTLLFPSLTGLGYKTSATLSITKSGCLIAGTGSEYGTRVHVTASNTTAFSVIPSGLDGTRDQTNLIRGLLITGPGSASSGYGVYATSDVHLENVGVAGFWTGLYWGTATFYSRAYGCFFTNCVRGVTFDGTNNCTLDTCRITGNFGGGGLIGPVTDGVVMATALVRGLINRIVNCSIEYFAGDGIRLNGGGPTEIVGNYFETQQSASGKAHIRIGESNWTYSTRIESNYFQGDGTSGFDAIAMDKANGVVIASNHFGVNAAIGISTTGNTSNILLWNNLNSPAGTFSLPASSYTLDPAAPPAILTSSAPAASAPGDSGAVGAGATAARYNHVHGREAWGVAGDIGSETFGASASAGSSGKVADAGHVHPMPAAPSGGHFLVISSGHSTPLVFDDVVQTSAGDDFVYTS